MIRIKRVYEDPVSEDGYRMLVDRLWPRGLKKENAHLDEWNKEIAPSATLRKWFGHKPELFEEFAHRYEAELSTKNSELKRIKTLAHKQNLTLLYAAKNIHVNHAKVLLDILLNT